MEHLYWKTGDLALCYWSSASLVAQNICFVWLLLPLVGFRTDWTSLSIWSNSSPVLLWPAGWDADLQTCLAAYIWELGHSFISRGLNLGGALKKTKTLSSHLCSGTYNSVPLACSTTCFLIEVDESLCRSISLLHTWQVPDTVTVLRSLISPLLQSALLSCSLRAVALVCRELLGYASCSWKLNSKKELCLLPACSPVYPINTNDLAVQKIKLLLAFFIRSAGITFV